MIMTGGPTARADRLILAELERNAREPIARIARRARVGKQTAHYKVQNLERKGVITGYAAMLDVARLGFINHEVWVQTRNISAPKREMLIAELAKHPNACWLCTFYGKWDFVISVLARNTAHFNKLFTEILEKNAPAIRDYAIDIAVDVRNFSRSYLAEKRQIAYYGGEPKPAELDATDVKLLKTISKNARISMLELAKAIGVTPPTARAKLRRLEAEGVITGNKAVIDPAAFGYQYYEIPLLLENLTLRREAALRAWCAAHENVIWWIRYVGRWDADIGVEVRGGDELQRFLAELRERFSDIIRDLEVAPGVKEYKYDYTGVLTARR